MSRIPDLPGILTADEVLETASAIAVLQLSNGMIPWFEGGHCDPWNHVETAIALDIAGMHAAAERAYEWLVETQRPDGSWHNYYLPDGERDLTVEEVKRRLIVRTLEATGSISEAARKLGISSRTIYNKMREWNLSPESFSNGRV